MVSCIKYVVVFYNFLFWLLGVIILSFSAYLWWDSQDYLDLDEVNKFYITPFVVFATLGAVMTVVGFLGCCGAIRESKCILGMYFLFCMTMCIVCGACLYWAIHNEDMLRDRIKRDTTKMVKVDYGTGKNNATENFIDRIQRDFTCCGIDGPEDWNNSNYNNINPSSFERGIKANLPEQGTFRIPHTCCQLNSVCTGTVDRVQSSQLKQIEGLHLNGCLDKFEQFVQDKWQIILLAGAGIVGLQLFALLFACFLCCAISRQEDK